MPAWETIVEMMHDQQLDSFPAEVVNVIYSKDNAKRYIILKNENGVFTYLLEEIYQHDEYEWRLIVSHDYILPAMWVPSGKTARKSLFATEKELIKEIKTEPVYRQYFAEGW